MFAIAESEETYESQSANSLIIDKVRLNDIPLTLSK